MKFKTPTWAYVLIIVTLVTLGMNVYLVYSAAKKTNKDDVKVDHYLPSLVHHQHQPYRHQHFIENYQPKRCNHTRPVQNVPKIEYQEKDDIFSYFNNF